MSLNIVPKDEIWLISLIFQFTPSIRTQSGKDKAPTETITTIGSNVTFELRATNDNFFVEEGKTLIVDNDGTLDIGKYWFKNFNNTKFEGSLIIMDRGMFYMSESSSNDTNTKLSVGPKDGGVNHPWGWKQDGTKTVITSDGNWTFKAETGSGNNTIDIRHTGVVTPIIIDEGVTATISETLVQQSSTFTNKGTVEVTGTFEIKESDGIVFGTKDAGLIIKPNGTLKYSTSTWLTESGVGDNGFVRIEGGGLVTLGNAPWFGPTAADADYRFNIGSNLIVEFKGSLLTAYRKSDSDTNNTLSTRTVNDVFGTPGIDILVKEGVEFNVKDKFGSRGDLEVEAGAFFTVEGSYAVGVRTYEQKAGSSAWTAINPTPTTDKKLTIKSGASFEIKQGRKIELVGKGKIGKGTIDIEAGATVKVNNETDPNAYDTYKDNVSNHTVKYDGAQVYPEP